MIRRASDFLQKQIFSCPLPELHSVCVLLRKFSGKNYFSLFHNYDYTTTTLII